MDIVCITAAVLITLIPVSSIVSQFWGTNKKMVGSRVATSILSIISCFVLLVIDLIARILSNQVLAYKLLCYSLIAIAIFMNLLVIWLQRDERSRKFRSRINIGVLLVNIAVVVTVGYGIISTWNAFGKATDGHWEEAFDGSETQEERNTRYDPYIFESDFGFSLPEYDVIEMRYWSAGWGLGGYLVIVKTKQSVSDKFFQEQVKKNVLELDSISYKNGVFYGNKDQEEWRIERKEGNNLMIEKARHG